MKHARLQPSRAHRWLVCPGSVEAEATAPDVRTIYANRGTALHQLLTELLDEGHLELRPQTVLVEDEDGSFEYEVTETDVQLVVTAARWALDRLRELDGGAVLVSEQHVPVGRFFGLPSDALSGHADIIIDGDEELDVVDAKFGWQDAEETAQPQLSLYALGEAERTGWRHKRYRLVVLQPGRGEPKEEVLTPAELRERGERYRPAVLQAMAPDAERVPGSQCLHCRAAGTCRAYQDKAAEDVAMAMDLDPKNLSAEELGALLDRAKYVRHAVDAAEAAAMWLLEHGAAVPGRQGPWKRVAGRGERHWRDEAQAERMLRMLGLDPHRKTLLSPNQAEELLGAERSKLLTPLAPKVPGKPTLAPGNDPRPALDAADGFDSK